VYHWLKNQSDCRIRYRARLEKGMLNNKKREKRKTKKQQFTMQKTLVCLFMGSTLSSKFVYYASTFLLGKTQKFIESADAVAMIQTQVRSRWAPAQS